MKETEIREAISASLKCIESGCDQHGVIPNQVGEDEWEAQQCQFCYEVRFPHIEAVLALRAKELGEIRKWADDEESTMRGFNNDGMVTHSGLCIMLDELIEKPV